MLRRVQILRPSETDKLLAQSRQRQAHNIEIAAFDPRNIAACATLNRIGTRLVERLAGGHPGLALRRWREDVHDATTD